MSVSLPLPRSEGVAFRRFFDLALLDNRYPALHGMRALAIGAVVQHDATMFLTLKARVQIDPLLGGASLALFFSMDLFFVLSGFLIGSQLIRSIESSGLLHTRAFYVRRALRTIPLYYLVLSLFAIATPLTSAQRRHLWLEYAFIGNYRFPLVSGDLVMPWGWSLALVEQFYLAAPLLLFLLYKLKSDRARLTALCALWLLALVVRLTLLLRHPNWTEHQVCDFIYYRSHARFDTFVGGVAVAYVHHRWHEPIARWLRSPRARAAAALPSLVCLWFLMHPWMFGWGAVRLMQILAWGTLTTILYGGWIVLALNDDGGWIQRGLSARIFRSIATLGYGVYLTYLLLGERVVGPVARSLSKGRGWPAAVVWPFAVLFLFAVSLCAAYILHLLIEKPCSRLRVAAYSSGTSSTNSA
jgi:peptidoglycan/LPS O-acetylase OafA/YrhL